MDQDRIIDKVRKCLKLAADAGASEGERDNAMRQAHALMAKYNLDLAQVEQQEGADVNTSEPRLEHELAFYGRPWARQVCSTIGDLFFCSYLYRPATDAKHTLHSWIGRKSNAITAAEISQFVVNAIVKEARRAARDAGAGNEYRRAFALGAANSLRKRVRQMLEDAKKPTPETPIAVSSSGAAQSTALVLVNVYRNEAQANQAMIESLYPKLGKPRSGQGISSWDAHSAGQQFGKTVSLNWQVTDSRIKGQLK